MLYFEENLPLACLAFFKVILFCHTSNTGITMLDAPKSRFLIMPGFALHSCLYFYKKKNYFKGLAHQMIF
jgi:hypothetical protein